MRTVTVRNVQIGTGRPKICVPITGKEEGEILSAAKTVKASPADLIEWRADWFEGIFDPERTQKMLQYLRNTLGNLPLLFTFRTAEEGGEKEIDVSSYAGLNIRIAQSGMADLIDVEAFTGGDAAGEVIEAAHSAGVKVIASNHDFHKTPPREEIVSRLVKMQEMGADIAKIAVMPQSRRDVITLLSATEEMTSEHARIPVITMSMGKTGVISRICGETFGSAVTFGSAGRSSAPGQLDAGKLKDRVKALVPVLIPLFISAFRRADELATAMECRCYQGGEGRTRLKSLRMQKSDFAMAAVCIAVFVLMGVTSWL